MRSSSKLGLYIKASLIFLAVSFLFSSCKKEETDKSIDTSGVNSKPVTGVALVKVNVVGGSFEAPVGSAPGGASGTSANAATAVQRQVIPFNKDFNLVAELSPVSSNINNGVHSSAKGGNIIQSDLAQGVLYKVAVFDSTGNYVTERNYVHGSEGNTAALNLDGGSKYTFVAYSIGSTTNVPDIVFADSTAKSLNNSSFVVSQATGQGGVKPPQSPAMYYRVDLRLTGGQINSLDIVLKNKFSQVTTIIDGSALGKITALGASFYNTTTLVKINLKDSGFIYGGSSSIVDFLGSPILFPTVDSTIVTSTPTDVLGSPTAPSTLSITSLTAGKFTLKALDYLSINNVNLVPGVKYNLIIKLAKQTDSPSGTVDGGNVSEWWDVGTDDNRTYTLGK